ncbi:MAG: hypothetical protein ABIG42_08775 [bacterium]
MGLKMDYGDKFYLRFYFSLSLYFQLRITNWERGRPNGSWERGRPDGSWKRGRPDGSRKRSCLNGSWERGHPNCSWERGRPDGLTRIHDK